MAYNSYFPATYQPYQYQPYQFQQQFQQQMQPTQMSGANSIPQQMTPPTIHAEIVQVDGETAAANYPVGVGASQMMIAKDDSAIFIKTATQNGYDMAVYVRKPSESSKPENEYITRAEFEARIKALSASTEVLDNESV